MILYKRELPAEKRIYKDKLVKFRVLEKLEIRHNCFSPAAALRLGMSFSEKLHFVI